MDTLWSGAEHTSFEAKLKAQISEAIHQDLKAKTVQTRNQYQAMTKQAMEILKSGQVQEFELTRLKKWFDEAKKVDVKNAAKKYSYYDYENDPSLTEGERRMRAYDIESERNKTKAGYDAREREKQHMHDKQLKDGYAAEAANNAKIASEVADARREETARLAHNDAIWNRCAGKKNLVSTAACKLGDFTRDVFDELFVAGDVRRWKEITAPCYNGLMFVSQEACGLKCQSRDARCGSMRGQARDRKGEWLHEYECICKPAWGRKQH